MGRNMETEHIISPEVAGRAGAKLNRVLTACGYNPTTGKWDAVSVGYLTLPARPIAAGGDGKVRGKRTHGYARSHELQSQAAQLAEYELRRDYSRCLPHAPTAPVAPTPLAG